MRICRYGYTQEFRTPGSHGQPFSHWVNFRIQHVEAVARSVVFRGWLCFPASCQSCRFVSARLDEPCSRGRRFRGAPRSGRRLVFSVWVLLTRVWAACASGKVCPLCCGPPRTHQAPRVTGRPPAPWSSAPCELWGLQSLTPWQGGGATPLPRSATPQATAARSSRPRSVFQPKPPYPATSAVPREVWPLPAPHGVLS